MKAPKTELMQREAYCRECEWRARTQRASELSDIGQAARRHVEESTHSVRVLSTTAEVIYP